MKSNNEQNRKTTRSNFEYGSVSKRNNWNNKRRYSYLTQNRII